MIEHKSLEFGQANETVFISLGYMYMDHGYQPGWLSGRVAGVPVRFPYISLYLYA